MTFIFQYVIILTAESRGRLALRKEVCFMEMEQLILYIILAFIVLEILKTIKK